MSANFKWQYSLELLNSALGSNLEKSSNRQISNIEQKTTVF
jgi:hypothetical protein